MAIEVPKDAKVYTTKYANFKGVDYTNDSSNVWYRRSPNGVNMLPALDGKPYKRNGWKVEVPASEFIRLWLDTVSTYDSSKTYSVGDTVLYNDEPYRCITAVSVAEPFDEDKWILIDQPVESKKVFYFELGGSDYMVMFNSYGMFVYVNDTLTRINSYYVDEYAPENAFPYPPEHEKAFFFEGQGDVGFYFFAGDSMFVYDGNMVRKVAPKVPIVLIGCDADGVGTVYEDVNMLTRERTIQYTCENTPSTYEVPGGFSNEPIIRIKDTSAADGWSEPLVKGTDYTLLTPQITFLPGKTPPELVQGEDNLQITYIPDDGYTITQTEEAESKIKQVFVQKQYIYTEKQTKTVVKTAAGTVLSTDYKTSKTSTAEWGLPPTDFVLDNPKANESGTYDHVAQYRVSLSPETWHNFNNPSAWIDREYFPYNNTITIKPKKELFSTEATNSGGQGYAYGDWSSWSEWKLVSHKKDTPTKGIHQYKYTRVRTLENDVDEYAFVRILYTKLERIALNIKEAEGSEAFWGCTRVGIFGNGLVNQVFFTASTHPKYTTRVWYSAATDPTYFPDTNYMEVGATDKEICGLIKVGDYLGIVKQGGGSETSVYLAYPTSFEDETTYAVKQSVNGIGAISNGAFNILNDEPLFLSAEGVMAIEPNETVDRKIRNRSYYINQKLKNESNIQNAFSFVFNNMYWLGINNHCYVLDGSQKSSWENEKTNLQYECYYLENVPAQCFAKYGGRLWFADKSGNMCRFKADNEQLRFVDDYIAEDGEFITAESEPTSGAYSIDDLTVNEQFGDVLETNTWTADVQSDIYDYGSTLEFDEAYTEIDSVTLYIYVDEDSVSVPLEYTLSPGEIEIVSGQEDVQNIGAECIGSQYDIFVSYRADVVLEDIEADDVIYDTESNLFYTVTEVGDETVNVAEGVPIRARWGTIADDDGSAHYQKNLQKKGSLVALLPINGKSGVEVTILADEGEAKGKIFFMGEVKASNYILPFHKYLKKKIKKYKRLQIVCENNQYDRGFGIDQIIKLYTIGNYAKR